MSARRLLAVVAIAITATALTLVGDDAHADFVGPSSAPKFAFLDQAVVNAGTCATVIPAVSGKRFRVWSEVVQNQNASAAGLFRLQDGSNPSETPYLRVAALATFDKTPATQFPLFETTTTNSALSFCTHSSGGMTASVQVVYTEFDPNDTPYANQNQPVTNTGTSDVFVTNTSSDRVPVDLDASDVGGGGGSGEVTLSAIDGDALTYVDEWREVFFLVGGLVVFLLVGILIYGHFPRKKLPL